MKPSYVYVASSWRNPVQTAVCAALRSVGIDLLGWLGVED